MNEILEKYRVLTGEWATKKGDDKGLFFIPIRLGKPKVKVICANMDNPLMGWQHVSCSLPNRCPTWKEMAYIKKLFWGENVTVVQFHPGKSEYVNNHPFCLHLWRHIEGHELPPSILTGLKGI